MTFCGIVAPSLDEPPLKLIGVFSSFEQLFREIVYFSLCLELLLSAFWQYIRPATKDS